MNEQPYKSLLFDLADAAERFLEEPEPTHLTPNPAWHEARVELQRQLDRAIPTRCVFDVADGRQG